MSAAKKKTRRIPSRKLRSPKTDRRLAEAKKALQRAAEMLPQTAQVIESALQVGARVLNQAAIEQLGKADQQLAEQLIALLAKKRSS